MNNTLHPLFQQILGLYVEPREPIEVACYRAALERHDWHFEFSDDHSVYERGRAERKSLDSMRNMIDRNGAIWNEYAPKDMQVSAPITPSLNSI